MGRVKSQRSACRYGARDRSTNLKDTVRGSDKVMTSLTITVNCSRMDSSWSSMVHILVCLEIQVSRTRRGLISVPIRHRCTGRTDSRARLSTAVTSGTVRLMKNPSPSLERRIRLLLNSSCDEPICRRLERVTMMSKEHLTVISHGLYMCVQTLLMLQNSQNSQIPRIPCSCSSRAEELQSPQTYSQPISYVSSFPS